MNSKASNQRQHAVVIGGSMAGLLAARVLSDHYEEVTVLDRDDLSNSRHPRRGVPQARHTHGLLAGGCQALETLFPGISEQMAADGAVRGDILGDSRWFIEGACHTRFHSGMEGQLMSRPFLESSVRERVRRIANVRFRDNCEVSGLATSPKDERVTGVKLNGETLAADLVMDTAGRGAHAPQWLEAMGFPRPQEERVEISLGYTTRMFRRDSTDLGGDVAVIVVPTPSGKRGGVMLAQEDNRWSVTLTTHFIPAAPMELKGFVEFARTLPAPFIYEVVRRAEPVSEPATLRFPASVRRRYERLDRFPTGYLVMGDAISSFNPVYGQGMTVAALEALELETVLAQGTASLARRFFTRVAKVVDIPWSMAVGNDLRMPEVAGPRPFGVRVINAYLERLHKAAHHDPAVALAFHRVGNLLAPPPSVLHPRIALRVLKGNLRASSRRAVFARPLSAGAGR